MFEKLFDIEISVPTRFLLEVVLRRSNGEKMLQVRKKCSSHRYKKKKKLKIEEDNFMMTNLILCLIR